MKGMRSVAPMGIRIPDDLKEKISEKAKENGRSMNAEIVHRLEESLSAVTEGSNNSAVELELESEKQLNANLIRIIDVLNRTVKAREENAALIKQHVKLVTGYDVQEFLNEVVDYEAIRKKYEDK